ncbi:Lrp/AsnC family transcriptional regulator [archaeon]|nr:Lrp/AsnC family transcriptional regulator [archaeon]
MTKKLDAWDKKILSEIEFNYKKSHQKIAQKIKRSKAFVTYRIKKLEEENIITYRPLIDYSRLGQTYYRVTIETLLDKEELVKYLSETAKVVWLVERYDQENFVIVLRAKSFGEFQDIWEKLYEKIAKYILSKDISLAYKVYHFPLTFLHNATRKDFYVTGANEPIDLSETEEKVLQSIQNNPIASLKSKAEKLGINSNTFKKAMKNLEEKKVILAYQTLVNKEVLGLRHYKLYLSFPFTKEDKNKIITVLKNNPYVIYITETSYHYDLECELFSPSSEAFEKTVSELKKHCFSRIVISQTKSEQKVA